MPLRLRIVPDDELNILRDYLCVMHNTPYGLVPIRVVLEQYVAFEWSEVPIQWPEQEGN